MASKNHELSFLSYSEQRSIIKNDMLAKYQREDWHGVMDCAADLRELDAFERGKKEPCVVCLGSKR